MTLHISARLTYRWLRRQPRSSGDRYLEVSKACSASDMSASSSPSHDLPCKTIDAETPGLLWVRTRSSYGRPHHREVARLLARLLRTAARSGVAMVVRSY